MDDLQCLAFVLPSEISLHEALQLDMIKLYGQRATGAKYLINPNKDASASADA